MSVKKIEVETVFGRCRCCLAYGYLKNMWIEHQFDGEAEVYGEMLVQCFALTWDHSEDSMEQDQICEQCIFRLRDASDFKKVVLSSQDELLQELESENMIAIKEERLEEEFLEDCKADSEADTADNTYYDPEFIMDNGDTGDSDKDEEYEEIEYLEDEDAAPDALDTDSSQQTDQSKQVRIRRKPTRHSDPDDDDAPKRKWPKKLPKSERQKTYKQYSEVDLRKCLEEVRKNILTPAEAAEKYDIPKKTICAKVKAKPSDVWTDIHHSTNNTTPRESVTADPMDEHIIINEDPNPTDVEANKHLMRKHKHNLKMILKYSNATLIKGSSSAGYSCCFCDKHFNAQQLKEHNLEHGDVYDDAIKVKYVSDLIIRLDITGLECNLCDKAMASHEELMSHLKEHHFVTIYTDIDNHIVPFKFDSETLRCVLCTEEFKHFKLLSEHMNKHYSNYKCPECDEGFINKRSMKTHSYRHKKGKFECSQCLKVFDNLLKVREHVYVTHKLVSKKRKCGFCDKKFSSADMVKNHEAREHGCARPQLTCEVCNKLFATEKILALHKKRHMQLTRPFGCSSCERRFYTKQELEWHRVTHTKTKNFHCNICENSFGTQPGLRQHLRAHLGYRKYTCDYCKKAFVHLSTWKRHVIKIHNVEAGSSRRRFK